MRGSVLSMSGFLLVALAAFSAPVQGQALETPPFVVGANKVYCHASPDSLSVWMSTLEDDGATPFQPFGGPTTPPDPVLGLTADPVANGAFLARIPLLPVLTQDLVLDGTITVQAYIGGGSATAGAATLGTSLEVDGTSVASAAAKNHVMTPQQAGTTYNAISWTMSVAQLEVPAGSTVEWVISGTVVVGNNVYIACHAARGRSYIELPVATTSAAPGAGNATDSDADGLNDTWEMEQFGNLTAQNGTGDPDGDGLNNTAEFEQGTNATLADTDADGLSDGNETEIGTNATNPDTDGDGATDGEEVEAGTDPLDPSDFPVATADPTNGTDETGNGTLEEESGQTGGPGDETEKAGLDQYLDSIKADTGYAGASAAGMLAVMVLSLIGLAGRWGL